MSVADALLSMIKRIDGGREGDPTRWYPWHRPWPGSRSKYVAHQGPRECERRLSQAATLAAKRLAKQEREDAMATD